MRGKKYSDDIKEKAIALYATNKNFAETSRIIGVPHNTIQKWVKEKPPDEFDELRQENVKGFIEKAGEIIDISMERLKRTLLDEDVNIPVNQLTACISALYDKRALANGESTDNIKINVTLPPELVEYAE